MPKEWNIVFKYVVSGASSVALQFSILYGLVDVSHIDSTVASTVAYLSATVFLYLLLYHWAFRSDGKHGVVAVRYALTSSLMLGLNFLIFWVMNDWAHIWYIYSQIVASSVVATVNYYVNRSFTFY